ncbi:hypothetical protein [Flavobacterium sp.]|uniref:hypothetical protein n=1 Tax=Flavobacterium sp. TaxID=239 RepID=UPI00286DF4EF|nr:hypothetical protein [Flavobacterium sp.]
MKLISAFKTILTAMVFIIATNYSSAQTAQNYDQGFRLGIGISGGLPFEKPYDFNLGADARLQYDLSKKYSVTLTTGFNNLFVASPGKDLGYVPVKLGFKAFVIEDQFYLMGEAGGAFAVTNSYNQNSLLLSPSIGYVIDNFDISLKYEHFSDFKVVRNNAIETGLNQIALRVAYGFKL